MKNKTLQHKTLTGRFDTESAIHYLRSSLTATHISAIGQRASEWNVGNAIGVEMSNKWFSACANQDMPLVQLANDYLTAKDSMISAIFAVQ